MRSEKNRRRSIWKINCIEVSGLFAKFAYSGHAFEPRDAGAEGEGESAEPVVCVRITAAAGGGGEEAVADRGERQRRRRPVAINRSGPSVDTEKG